ncbi:MAG: carbon storage regulator CsrA [Leptospiraceae bacterium]|nr:carbon storage regulator CsrA [Leptospiraceae bacterium]MCB1200593.1 carbon storage regulator CsrA [Leptospiraceae bacterium]
MLVLARKINDSIIIDDSIEILIVEIKGDQVKIGIKAPKSVKVYRGEIYDEIKKENIAASSSEIPDTMPDLKIRKKP